MEIVYRVNAPLTPAVLAAVLDASGIKRPTDDLDRISRMFSQANLIVTAWDGEKLVGVARALTDYCWCCYLSDLAVDRAYQKQGIGRALITQVREEAGPDATLLLLSAPEAMAYYPKLGFEAAENAWILPRRG